MNLKKEINPRGYSDPNLGLYICDVCSQTSLLVDRIFMNLKKKLTQGLF